MKNFKLPLFWNEFLLRKLSAVCRDFVSTTSDKLLYILAQRTWNIYKILRPHRFVNENWRMWLQMFHLPTCFIDIVSESDETVNFWVQRVTIVIFEAIMAYNASFPKLSAKVLCKRPHPIFFQKKRLI